MLFQNFYIAQPNGVLGEQKCRRGAAADVGVATGELLVHPDGIARPDW